MLRAISWTTVHLHRRILLSFESGDRLSKLAPVLLPNLRPETIGQTCFPHPRRRLRLDPFECLSLGLAISIIPSMQEASFCLATASMLRPKYVAYGFQKCQNRGGVFACSPRHLHVQCCAGLVERYDRELVHKKWMTDRGACSRGRANAQINTLPRSNQHCSGLLIRKARRVSNFGSYSCSSIQVQYLIVKTC